MTSLDRPRGSARVGNGDDVKGADLPTPPEPLRTPRQPYPPL